MKNQLIVIGDSLRYDTGMEAFDWLRAKGVSYTYAWSNGGATYPAMPSIWTGLEVHEHGAICRPLCPLAPGIDRKLTDIGYNVYSFTENTNTPWVGVLLNDDPLDHGKTVEMLEVMEFEEPWVVIYHSMVPHWPYKFVGLDLPEGWPADHPEIHPEAYYEAYRQGVMFFASQIKSLVRELSPDVTILTSDHGEAFMEHGQYLHAPWMMYPEQLHVPLIVNDGQRKKTDRGLISTAHLWDIAEAASQGQRVKAKDKYVRVEDYHQPGQMVYAMVADDGYLYHVTGTYDLTNDPDCTEYVDGRHEPDNFMPPPVRPENAFDPGLDTRDEPLILERLRKLGYVE